MSRWRSSERGAGLFLPSIALALAVFLLPGSGCGPGEQETAPPEPVVTEQPAETEGRMPVSEDEVQEESLPPDVAAQVKCPALIIGAEHDVLIPETLVRKMAEKIPSAQYQVLNCDHFEPYYGPVFDKNISLQLTFLKQLLYP